jgi:hypothetical protein
MRNRRRWVTKLAFLIVLLSPVSAPAQTNISTGMIRGTVLDPEGAPLEGAVVEARNPETGFVRRADTLENGNYAIHLLPPGTFELRTDYEGLQTEIKRGIVVSLGSLVQVDFHMRPATFSDELVVTAQSPVVETASSTVSASVSDTAIANLPLNGRDFSDFILLTPGAVTARSVDIWNQEARGTHGEVNIGARSVQNSFNIDGATAQSSFTGNERSGEYTPFTFSQAAIKEFQVIRSYYSLEFSAGGAVINAITRSGGNEIHGEVFGYYRDERFIGADAKGNEADDFTQLQYGFALGGPIVRDQLHFFVSYDEQDFDVPTYREFEELPADRESDWEDLTGLDLNEETGLLMGLNDARVVLLRFDWQLSPNHLATARYNTLSVPNNENLLNPFSSAGWSSNGQVLNDSDSAVISLNSVVSERVMNEAFIQYAVERRPYLANTTSIPEAWIRSDDSEFGQWRYLPGDFSERRWQVVDNLSYSVGRHLLQAGINLDFVSFESLYLQNGGGFYTFENWEDFFGDEPEEYRQAFSPNDGWVKFGTNAYAVYIQDEWQAAPSLSLVYGLRYDYQDHDQPRSINPLYPLTGQIPNDGDNVSARLGAAWDPSGDGKAVLRGGIGLFYDATPTTLDSKVQSDNGVETVQLTAYCQWELNPNPCPTFPNRWESLADLTTGVQPDIFLYDPGFENPQTLRMSLGYDRKVFADFSIGIDLIYSRSRDLQSKQDQNLAPTDELTVDGRTIYERGTVEPDFGRIIMFRSDARATSRSVVLSAHKRFSNRWFLDASYTWSDIRDNGSNQTSLSRGFRFPEDQYNIEADWGPANFDVRHKIVISGGVYLPYQFMISGYVFARSGFPYSAYHYHDLNGDGYSESERAVIEAEGGVYYHYPRNTFRQPWFYSTNLRLSKSFRLGRGTEIELIGEVFNLFDHANWYTTKWDLSWGCWYEGGACGTGDSFGELNQIGRPRQYQFGLRLRF